MKNGYIPFVLFCRQKWQNGDILTLGLFRIPARRADLPRAKA